MVWKLFPFKGDFTFGKSQKSQGTKARSLGCRGAESPGCFDVSPKNSAWDVMHKRMCCRDKAANHQSLITVDFWIIWIVFTEECSSLMQNLMQICCSTLSVIVNAMATQYTCSFNSVYHPHWLVQRSHHYSHMHTPVHSPWWPACMDVTQTILIVLTTVGHFLDRTHKTIQKSSIACVIFQLTQEAVITNLCQHCGGHQNNQHMVSNY